MKRTIDEILKLLDNNYLCSDPYECPFSCYERKGPGAFESDCTADCPWSDIHEYLEELKNIKEVLGENQ